MDKNEAMKRGLKLSVADRKILRAYADIFTETGSKPTLEINADKKTSISTDYMLGLKRG